MTIIIDRCDVDDVPAALMINDLVMTYGRRAVLRGISARLPRSRVTAIVGPNGAGKSTLLDAMAGVRPPASGSITHHGRRRPAYVPQRSDAPDVLPISVRATVAMGRWPVRGRWRWLTAHDRAVVEDCMAQLGIHRLADDQLGALSGGQRQRVLVAQGLAQEADLLLLDEPAAGLDLAAQRSIEDAIRHYRARGGTVVRVTHDLRVARQADHCLVLDDGTVAAAGDPATVLTPEAVSRAWGVPELEEHAL
jgi:zinc/manganese transport system ATP-binding protein